LNHNEANSAALSISTGRVAPGVTRSYPTGEKALSNEYSPAACLLPPTPRFRSFSNGLGAFLGKPELSKYYYTLEKSYSGKQSGDCAVMTSEKYL